MRSLLTNSSKRPFPPWPRSVATATRISLPAPWPVKRKPEVTPTASWGTGNGRTRMAPTANSAESKVQTGPDRGDRERIRRENGRTFSSCRRIGTSWRGGQGGGGGGGGGPGGGGGRGGGAVAPPL